MMRLAIGILLAFTVHTIAQIQPLGIRPGQTNTIHVTGENLSGARAIEAVFSGFTLTASIDESKSSQTQVIARIAVPCEVPMGIGMVQLGTTNGPLSPRLFLVDPMQSVPESGTNNTITAAQPLSRGAVDGQTDELKFDYFAYKAKRDEILTLEVVAHRIGSRLDPVMRVLDGKGRELAYCDDDPPAGRDSRLRVKFPRAGAYLIEVRDINYGGGQSFFYRLRAGNFPLPSIPFPVVINAETNVAILGNDQLAPVRAKPPSMWLPVRAKKRGNMTLLSATVTTNQQMVEVEPNDTTNTATRVTVPAGLSARFIKANDLDLFQFDAEKDDKLVFRARTRSLGSPCDLFMDVRDASGKTIAEFDPTGPDEGTLTNSFKDKGTYFLAIEELNHRGAPDLAYHLTIEKLEPGFALSVETNVLSIASSGAAELRINVTREHYDGPIEITTDNDSLSLQDAKIAEKKNEGTIKVQITDKTLVHAHFVGKAKVGDRALTVPVSTLPALKKLWPNMLYPPRDLDGIVMIGVRSANARTSEKRQDNDDDE